jgi:methylphosphotriester-DNA--protein-cysteine methyltransferase
MLISMLDSLACERAWLARDPDYDGRFFIRVLSPLTAAACPHHRTKRSGETPSLA